MQTYSKTFEVKWADMDPNRHMRHSVYNDYAAQTRVGMFSDFDLSITEIGRLGFGPVLFREETQFLREINLLETIRVTCALTTMRRDGSRWSFQHEIFKGGENSIKAAQINVDGAWLDLNCRKLGVPTPELQKVMNRFPKTSNYEWLPDKT
ncbi:acyl-CoA thioesterase [Rhodohalobacter barkolensis]|uniref:Thioesterase n=1 Tax=Rhodohalobacter barkolensis TaxID=2053187 RepID=A0A2N0VGQ9_9BACT|nr:thioesterase family protein [Rhodohalobacter barkolensis]PKD43367.1 thioesterase [Rhodohalobacter barkolensis]